MNKNMLITTAVIVTLLAGWLVLEVAALQAPTPAPGAADTAQRAPASATGPQDVEMAVKVETPPTIGVEVE